MKIGINRIVKYSDEPPYNIQRVEYEFNENGVGKYIVELVGEYELNSASKRLLASHILYGKFGTKPNIYKWVNRPSTINGTKKNHRKL